MGLMERILHRAKTDSSNASTALLAGSKKNLAIAEKIVHDYGTAMASRQSMNGGCIADIRRLPHPKARVKDAIVFLLRLTDDPQFREQLKSSYILLADWQEGVDLAIAKNHANADAGGDAAEVVKDIAAKDAAWEAWEKWRPKVLDEERALKAELQELGLW